MRARRELGESPAIARRELGESPERDLRALCECSARTLSGAVRLGLSVWMYVWSCKPGAARQELPVRNLVPAQPMSGVTYGATLGGWRVTPDAMRPNDKRERQGSAA